MPRYWHHICHQYWNIRGKQLSLFGQKPWTDQGIMISRYLENSGQLFGQNRPGHYNVTLHYSTKNTTDNHKHAQWCANEVSEYVGLGAHILCTLIVAIILAGVPPLRSSNITVLVETARSVPTASNGTVLITMPSTTACLAGVIAATRWAKAIPPRKASASIYCIVWLIFRRLNHSIWYPSQMSIPLV